MPRRTVPGPPPAPDVSVVVIGYNDRANLPNAVRSVLDQTLRNLEVIVVDDCSTDGSGEVAEELAREDPRITVVRLPENSGGCSRPRNAGLDLARAPFVMFLDSDDVYERHALQEPAARGRAHRRRRGGGAGGAGEPHQGQGVALGEGPVRRPGRLPRRPRQPDDLLRPAVHQQDLPARVPGPARDPVPRGRALRGLAVLHQGLLPGRDASRSSPTSSTCGGWSRTRRSGRSPSAATSSRTSGTGWPCTG